MDGVAETIADIGELALIERLKAFCAEGAIGDDAALMTVQPGHTLVVTTDMLTDTVHFSDRTTPPYAVGWRATAANLSDLAAMGATPLGITISLGLPPQTPWAWVKDLYQGIAACLNAHGGAIVGGDLCRCEQRTISITALGEVLPEQAIRRHTAIAGSVVVVTGAHGASRAGLAILAAELASKELASDSASDHYQDWAQAWIKAHQMPTPRLDAIACLRQIVQQGDDLDATITGMDSSDGLANALLQISHSSQVGMDIVLNQIPLPPGLSATIGPKTALEWALYGGEDFELVLCLSVELAQAFVATGFAIAIGTTTDTGIVQLVSPGDKDLSSYRFKPLSYKDFKHF